MTKKKVSFHDIPQVESTYSGDEYDRLPIDFLLYRKCRNLISNEDWRYETLDLIKFKLTEMIVHKKSSRNTSYKI